MPSTSTTRSTTRTPEATALLKPVDVEVLFDAQVARYVTERTFHPSESKEALPDGRVRYLVRAGGKNEVVARVLSFGGAAALVKPAEWRDEVRERARRAAGAHG